MDIFQTFYSHKNEQQAEPMTKYMKNIEKLLTTKSWWDSADAINIAIGHIAAKYLEVKEGVILNWMRSDNIWLKRVSVLFQLKYRGSTYTESLSRTILYNSNTDEFFTNKAMGWALREYSKTNKE